MRSTADLALYEEAGRISSRSTFSPKVVARLELLASRAADPEVRRVIGSMAEAQLVMAPLGWTPPPS